MATLPVYPRALYSLYLPLIMKIKVDACRRRAAKAKKNIWQQPPGLQNSSFVFVFIIIIIILFLFFMLLLILFSAASYYISLSASLVIKIRSVQSTQ